MAMTHERREEIARAKGFASYREYRKASPEARRASTAQLAAEDRTYKGRIAQTTRPPANRGRRQVEPLPGGDTLVTSRRNDVLRSQIAKAEQRDQRVRALLTVNADGQVRTVGLWQRGGWDAGAVRQLVDDHGGNVLAALAAAVSDGGGVSGAYDLTIGAGDIRTVDLTLS